MGRRTGRADQDAARVTSPVAPSWIEVEHAEFINPEHTVTLKLARQLRPATLDNTDHYPEPNQDQLSLRFRGHPWSQRALNRIWHDAGWQLFHTAATLKAALPDAAQRRPPRRVGAGTACPSRRWVASNVPGGLDGDFGQLCISAVLDEYGGPPEEQSSLNLVYLLGGDASTTSGNQPRSAPVLGGADEEVARARVATTS